MNGPVQGVATKAASRPVENEPPRDGAPPEIATPGTSNNPAKLAVIASDSKNRPTTTTGCCNWNAQPTCSPAERSNRIAAPNPAQAITTPAVYARASRRAPRSSPPALASASALRLRIGKTQGMTFSNRPPANAARSNCQSTGSASPPRIGFAPSSGTSPGCAVKRTPRPSPRSSMPPIVAGLGSAPGLALLVCARRSIGISATSRLPSLMKVCVAV